MLPFSGTLCFDHCSILDPNMVGLRKCMAQDVSDVCALMNDKFKRIPKLETVGMSHIHA